MEFFFCHYKFQFYTTLLFFFHFVWHCFFETIFFFFSLYQNVSLTFLDPIFNAFSGGRNLTQSWEFTRVTGSEFYSVTFWPVKVWYEEERKKGNSFLFNVSQFLTLLVFSFFFFPRLSVSQHLFPSLVPEILSTRNPPRENRKKKK